MQGHTGPPAAGGAEPGGAEAGGGGAEAGAASEEAARAICLRLLALSPRTRAQLAGALRRRGVPDEVADSVLGRFAEVGLIDDAAFARAWVESRHHGRGLARGLLAAELQQRGVGAEEVQAAVGVLAPDEEIQTARRLVAKRAAATRGRPLPGRIRQLVGLLARKGYSVGLAYRVVRETLEQEGVDTAGAGLDLASLEDLDMAEAADAAAPGPGYTAAPG